MQSRDHYNAPETVSLCLEISGMAPSILFVRRCGFRNQGNIVRLSPPFRSRDFPHCRPAVPSEIEVIDPPRGFDCPRPYKCVPAKENGNENEETVAIENQWLRVDAYAGTSLIDSVTVRRRGFTGRLTSG